MFQKTGAPEKGVRISEEGEWVEEQVPYGDDGFVTPPEEEKEDEDAAVEK